MGPGTLVRRSLVHYRRTHAAVVLAVAVAVSALAGSLVVGDSVRASLRDLVLGRLGRADQAVTATRLVRETLADDLGACPLVTLDGLATETSGGRRAHQVRVYGVDDRFWRFHGQEPAGPAPGEVLLSQPLAAELAAEAGTTVLLRVEQPSALSRASLFGRRDQAGRALRLKTRAVLPAGGLGEFTLRPQQQGVRAAFVSLAALQRALGVGPRVNTFLVHGAQDAPLASAVTIEDLGFRLRVLAERRALSLEAEAGFIPDDVADAVHRAAVRLGLQPSPVLAYLANTIEIGGRSIPYSLVAGVDPDAFPGLTAAGGPPPILLTDWAARDLQGRAGDDVTLSYYLWLEEGRLETRTSRFRLAGVFPVSALDRDFTPEYPGITDSPHVSDWDPPFPVDMTRIRPADEEYWDRHRTTPKAVVSLAIAQELWGHRLGRLTSIRLGTPGPRLDVVRDEFARALRDQLDPLQSGFAVIPVRAEGLAAAQGATDFGEYFAYFSSFVVWSSLLLAALVFRLGLDQRLREVGTLRALGYPPARLRRLFVAEGATLSALGGLLGVAGAAGYAALLVFGLRTLWVDAVGTRELTVHVTAGSLAAGAVGGVLAAVACIVATLRGLRHATPRSLLSGERPARPAAAGRASALLTLAAALSAGALLAAAAAGRIADVAAFFGAGTLLLVAGLALVWRWLAADRHRALYGAGPLALLRLGLRGAGHRPGRSLLVIALIATATFVIVAVGAFRRDAGHAADDPRSGTGGFTLMAESVLPLHHDPSDDDGREALNLTEAPLEGVPFARFRVRGGDDASCLNLYRPRDPRVLGAETGFLAEGRFTFQSSLASTPEERANPWRLLEGDTEDGTIPTVADATSLAYVLHRRLGDEVRVATGSGREARLRIVGALQDSVLQGSLVVSERHFQQAFPEVEGYRFFLIAAPPARAADTARALESALADLGFDVTATADVLARYHQVEGTYLTTFQALGGLGLLLGTGGLAAVLLRNILERRRELALLRAVGYRRGHVALLVLAENAALLLPGLLIGTVGALVAVVPTVLTRGGQAPGLALAGLLAAVLVTGLAVSRLAVAAVHRPSVREALSFE
jgi:ABC-type lipoprotein release transport system permease subunit